MLKFTCVDFPHLQNVLYSLTKYQISPTPTAADEHSGWSQHAAFPTGPWPLRPMKPVTRRKDFGKSSPQRSNRDSPKPCNY